MKNVRSAKQICHETVGSFVQCHQGHSACCSGRMRQRSRNRCPYHSCSRTLRWSHSSCHRNFFDRTWLLHDLQPYIDQMAHDHTTRTVGVRLGGGASFAVAGLSAIDS